MSSNQIGGQTVAMRTRRSFLGSQQSKSESIIVLQHSQGSTPQLGHNQDKCIVIEDQDKCIVIEDQDKCIVIEDSELSQREQSAPQPQQREELIEMDQSNSQEQAEASPNQSKLRKGRFSPAEQKIITDSVGQFLAQREISYQDFLILLNKKNVINTFLKKEKFFHILASRLPGRTPFCCYRFVKRQFNKDNRKGKWSAQEEKRLVRLVEKYGHKWTEIARQLGRTSDNVYDKFKAIGSVNSQKRSKNHWELKEFVHLLMQVNNRVKTKFLIEEIEKELQSERYYNALESLSQRQSKYNTTNSAKPLTGLALRYVNEEIKRIDVQGISWSCIAGKLKRRSLIDCKNKFMQLFEYVLKKLKFEDMLIVEFVEKQGVEEEGQIDWLKWQHPRACYQQAKNRYNLLKKSIKNKQSKKFADILSEMRLKLSRRNAFD